MPFDHNAGGLIRLACLKIFFLQSCTDEALKARIDRLVKLWEHYHKYSGDGLETISYIKYSVAIISGETIGIL
jgi:hypothetical protein